MSSWFIGSYAVRRALIPHAGRNRWMLILFHVIGHQSKYIYRVLSGTFCLGGGGGGVDPEQIFPATQQREKFFRPSGGSGSMFPWKILKR